MVSLLDQLDRINKDNHGKIFHDQGKKISLFIISVDCMPGRKELVVLSNLSQLMAEKMDEPISHM